MWINYADLPKYHNEGPGWRGPELLEWSKYIEEGGMIMPMEALAMEGSDIKVSKAFNVEELPLKLK